MFDGCQDVMLKMMMNVIKLPSVCCKSSVSQESLMNTQSIWRYDRDSFAMVYVL